MWRRRGTTRRRSRQVKALIEQAKLVVEKHLDQAEAIQKKLGEATS